MLLEPTSYYIKYLDTSCCDYISFALNNLNKLNNVTSVDGQLIMARENSGFYFYWPQIEQRFIFVGEGKYKIFPRMAKP